jgi:2-polyprenyl-6-hydroxyphenyl methylase/3-demethylubiquinone-9 3-methyltransferase
MRWLPIGTHDWEKFVNPNDLITISKKNNLTMLKLDGMKYNLIKDQWTISNDKSVNYISIFNKN